MTDRDRKEFKHPSYGMASFHRIHNGSGRRLFGSSITDHHNTVRLTIGPGTLTHELNNDRYYGSLSGQYIEVEFSAAQFAELLTRMNDGSGVPCTILRRDGACVDDPPDIETETERIKNGFADTLKGYYDRANKYRREVDAATKGLPEKTRKKIQIALDVMEQTFKDNIPFVMTMFDEASTRVVTAAKHEIDAFATHVLGTMGLEAIKDRVAQITDGAEPRKVLSAGDSPRSFHVGDYVKITDVPFHSNAFDVGMVIAQDGTDAVIVRWQRASTQSLAGPSREACSSLTASNESEYAWIGTTSRSIKEGSL